MPALNNNSLTQKFNFGSSSNKIYAVILALAVFSGSATGYILASSKGTSSTTPSQQATGPASKAQQDTKTFRDFAQGTIQKKPDPKNGESFSTEGTHLLIRVNEVPVAVTSSVVDLTQYEGKKVKVYGETQKAIKEGWLMDVGRVEVQ